MPAESIRWQTLWYGHELGSVSCDASKYRVEYCGKYTPPQAR